MRIRHFHVRPNIPKELAPLEEIARNLWFSWSWEAVQLFIRLNPVLWEQSYQNPVQMLGSVPQADLEAAAKDESFVGNLERVYRSFQEYMKRASWFQEAHEADAGARVAYFSCEYGIDEGLPIYSGGLGVLSGDHLKSASDLGIPLVGVGLLYQKGYFRQVLSLDGWQKELYPDNDWYNMPVTMERADGRPLEIVVNVGGEMVKARVWRVDVGRTPLYLLDSNVKGNSAHSREITSTLYGGDRDMRIRQEILLGVGGARALKALGIRPTVYHMNEGHSAFLIVERIRDLMASHGLAFAQAREVVLASGRLHHPHPRPRGERAVRPGSPAEIPRSEDRAAGDPVGGVPRPGPVRRSGFEGVRDDGVRPPVVGVRQRRGEAPRRDLPGDVEGSLAGAPRAGGADPRDHQRDPHPLLAQPRDGRVVHAVLRAAVPREARGSRRCGSGWRRSPPESSGGSTSPEGSGSSSSPASG